MQNRSSDWVVKETFSDLLDRVDDFLDEHGNEASGSSYSSSYSETEDESITSENDSNEQPKDPHAYHKKSHENARRITRSLKKKTRRLQDPLDLVLHHNPSLANHLCVCCEKSNVCGQSLKKTQKEICQNCPICIKSRKDDFGDSLTDLEKDIRDLCADKQYGYDLNKNNYIISSVKNAKNNGTSNNFCCPKCKNSRLCTAGKNQIATMCTINSSPYNLQICNCANHFQQKSFIFPPNVFFSN